MSMRWILLLVSGGLLLMSCVSIRSASAERHANAECARPSRLTDGWQVASPEAAGIDATALCGVVDRAQSGELPDIHGLLVVRHGILVAERYFAGSGETADRQSLSYLIWIFLLL
jgi:hypothetical protein